MSENTFSHVEACLTSECFKTDEFVANCVDSDQTHAPLGLNYFFRSIFPNTFSDKCYIS